MKFRHRVLMPLCAALSLTTVSALAADPSFPNKPIKLIVGFAPSGSSDTVARVMAPRLGEWLKQNVVVENRAGAGGNIANDYLMKSPPDGYTIMLGTIGSLAVNQHLSQLSYDPVSDMAPISLAVVFTNVLVVNSGSNIKTLSDYVAQGKAASSSLSFGSSGVGSSGHLAGELLKSAAGLHSQHVAYRGGAPAMNDLLGGSLASIFSSPTDALKYIQAGKLRALATTGSKRLDSLPQVPTVAESGYPGFEAVNWYAFTAPLRTPPDVLQKLNAAIVATLNDPAVAAQLRKLGLDPAPTTPEEAQRYMRSESEKWGALVRKVGIKAE